MTSSSSRWKIFGFTQILSVDKNVTKKDIKNLKYSILGNPLMYLCFKFHASIVRNDRDIERKRKTTRVDPVTLRFDLEPKN